MEHDNPKQNEEELHMDNRIPARLQEVAEKMAKVGRTEYRVIRRPRWKEYSLVKYEGKKVISGRKSGLMNQGFSLQMKISSGNLNRIRW